MGSIYMEEIRRGVTRPLRMGGLTLEDWAIVFTLSTQVLVLTDRIRRMIFIFKLSHFLFLVVFAGLYLGALFLQSRKPPRYLAQGLRHLRRKRYLMAQGINEPKVSYWK